jgi:hypothetical protein
MPDMKKKLVLLLLFLNVPGWAEAPFRTYYDDKLTDKLLYLHALVNYDLHPEWYFDWERHLLSGNGVALSFGSVETQDLQAVLKININEPLTGDLSLIYRGRIYESQITQKPVRYGFIGLEYVIYNRFSAYLLANPDFDKEEVDLESGIRFTDAARENYLSIGLAFDDFTYDEKNDAGGISDHQPLGIHLLSRYSYSSFTLFSEAVFSNGFRRHFPDQEKSPVDRFHEQRQNTADLKLYYSVNGAMRALVGYSFYSFYEKIHFTHSAYDYTYENTFHDIYAEYLARAYKKLYLRTVMRYVFQTTASSGYRHFDFKRKEMMPAFFFEYRLARSMIELGYMGSLYYWDYDTLPPAKDFEREKMIEKIKLGWTYHFSTTSHIQLSLSHVFSIFGFGGANIQFIHSF